MHALLGPSLFCLKSRGLGTSQEIIDEHAKSSQEVFASSPSMKMQDFDRKYLLGLFHAIDAALSVNKSQQKPFFFCDKTIRKDFYKCRMASTNLTCQLTYGWTIHYVGCGKRVLLQLWINIGQLRNLSK